MSVRAIWAGNSIQEAEIDMDEKVVIKTKHGELTLQQLAEAQPGIARQMKEIGERFHVLYYAAKAGNWKLAQHELNVVISIFRVGGALRPKFHEKHGYGFIRYVLPKNPPEHFDLAAHE